MHAFDVTWEPHPHSAHRKQSSSSALQLPAGPRLGHQHTHLQIMKEIEHALCVIALHLPPAQRVSGVCPPKTPGFQDPSLEGTHGTLLTSFAPSTFLRGVMLDTALHMFKIPPYPQGDKRKTLTSLAPSTFSRGVMLNTSGL